MAELGYITHAAEVLHITQPAVTAQIKAPEEGLGVTLFDRCPGRISRFSLTRAGEGCCHRPSDCCTPPLTWRCEPSTAASSQGLAERRGNGAAAYTSTKSPVVGKQPVSDA